TQEAIVDHRTIVSFFTCQLVWVNRYALNMLLKCAAIELARRAPGVKLLAFHPGTVDTLLSRPFHANVPPGNVQSPELVADHLINLMSRLQPDGELSFLDWQGKSIEW
ncbi:hypothetical protein ACV1DD_16180, partial [Aeromonas veronii]